MVNITPSKYSLLNSASRSISRYCSGVRKVFGLVDTAASLTTLPPRLREEPVGDGTIPPKILGRKAPQTLQKGREASSRPGRRQTHLRRPLGLGLIARNGGLRC